MPYLTNYVKPDNTTGQYIEKGGKRYNVFTDGSLEWVVISAEKRFVRDGYVQIGFLTYLVKGCRNGSNQNQ